MGCKFSNLVWRHELTPCMLSFLTLFFVSSLYHLLLCYSLFFLLSPSLSVFPDVILCFFLLSLSFMLFFVFIILLFPLPIFPYAILCFFLLSPSYSVFPLICYSLFLCFVTFSYVILCFPSIIFFYFILCCYHSIIFSLSLLILFSVFIPVL